MLECTERYALESDCAGGFGLRNRVVYDGLAIHGRLALQTLRQASRNFAELLAKHAVLLAKVVNDLQLALVHPSGNGDQQKTEWVENPFGFQSLLWRLRADREAIANSCRSGFQTIRGI